MGQAEVPVIELYDERLRVDEIRVAGGAVAHVADSHRT
jgi:hypothetical protein